MSKSDHVAQVFVALQRLLPKHSLSRLVGRLARSQRAWLKNLLIRAAIRQFSIDLSEAADSNIENYKNFNDFFTRALADGARPVDKNEHSIVSPADGVISQIGRVDQQQLLQAKGIFYSIAQLLGSAVQAEQYASGSFVTVYLSPRDYHRVHLPVAARLVSTRYIPGDLFSVNDATVTALPGLFARNERLVCEFSADGYHFCLIMVGAMLVAGIETVWGGDEEVGSGMVREVDQAPLNLALGKAEEIARFKFGSTVILLFPQNVLTWAPDLVAGAEIKMGQNMAHFR